MLWSSITFDFLVIENTYKEKALKWCAENNHQLSCLYLKSGNEPLSTLKENVLSVGYKIISRREILDVLSKSKTSNNIFTDYLNYLQNIEYLTFSFLKLPPNEWEGKAWEGFFLALENKIEINSWGYVPNPNGGFMGLWGNGVELSDCGMYLQIEEGDLCFKIACDTENRSEIRNKYFSILIKLAEKKSLKEIKRPIRFGSGTYMTIAKVFQDDFLGENIINLENIILKWKVYYNLIHEIRDGEKRF